MLFVASITLLNLSSKITLVAMFLIRKCLEYKYRMIASKKNNFIDLHFEAFSISQKVWRAFKTFNKEKIGRRRAYPKAILFPENSHKIRDFVF